MKTTARDGKPFTPEEQNAYAEGHQTGAARRQQGGFLGTAHNCGYKDRQRLIFTEGLEDGYDKKTKLIKETFTIGFLFEADLDEAIRAAIRGFFTDNDAENDDNPCLVVSLYENFDSILDGPAKTFMDQTIEQAHAENIKEIKLFKGHCKQQ